MDFWDHLEELRRTILRALLLVGIGFCICLIFYDHLFQLATTPVTKVKHAEKLVFSAKNHENAPHKFSLPSGSQVTGFTGIEGGLKRGIVTLYPGETIEWEEALHTPKLALLSPTEGLSTMLKLCIWVSVLATSPAWLFLLARFIAPGLKDNEQSWIFPFVGLSLLLMFSGAAFAYFFTLPIANEFLLKLNAKVAMNLWSLNLYLNYTLVILFGNALAFESLAVLFLLIHKGWIQASTLKSKRRHVIVGIFILSAILTPPDVITQCMLALPMWLFYEVGCLYAYRRQSKRSVLQDTLT